MHMSKMKNKTHRKKNSSAKQPSGFYWKSKVGEDKKKQQTNKQTKKIRKKRKTVKSKKTKTKKEKKKKKGK